MKWAASVRGLQVLPALWVLGRDGALDAVSKELGLPALPQGEARGAHRPVWAQERPQGLWGQACGHQAAQGRCLQPC